MRIGELARRAGVTVETIRYYEREGLLEPAGRDRAGRDFDDGAADTLGVIRMLRGAGFGVRDIAVFLQVKDPDATPATRVAAARTGLDRLERILDQREDALRSARAMVRESRAELDRWQAEQTQAQDSGRDTLEPRDAVGHESGC